MELQIQLSLCCMLITIIYCDIELLSNVERMVEMGKHQYIILNEKTKVEKYGECWKKAIGDLHDGCHRLTEENQSVIALKFTDCFLKTSSHETCDCYNFEGARRKECMQSLSDRAFNAYTEFYTHTQNICFYLKSQIWHEETENTINRLSFASDIAANQLEELVDNSMNLKQALVDSHSNLKTMMAEFQIAAHEQQRLLFDVFDRISSLQEWAVGEISWFDTVVFYLCGLIIAHILTATPRTHNARFFLFLAFTVNIIAERYICHYFIDERTDKITNLNNNLSWWAWFCRKTLIFVSFIILTTAVIRYQDYNIINHDLLVQIQEQNMKLLHYLGKIKMLENNILEAPNETSVNITSDCKILGECIPQRHTSKESVAMPPSAETTSVLRKTEQYIQSLLQSNLNQIDIVHQPSRSSSPALSHVSNKTSSSSQRRRRKLNYETARTEPRYNLRYIKEEEKNDE